MPEAERTLSGGSAPDVVAPPPGHPRFPLYDSMRAIGALSVVVVHAATFSGAVTVGIAGDLLSRLNVGVTIFFLVSAFLLYRPFVAARVQGAPAIRVGDYLWRRWLRVVPAYWVALTVVAIYPAMAGIWGGDWWSFYGLLQNYPVGEAGHGCVDLNRCGIPPTWSLEVEVGFYLLLPVYALAMDRVWRWAGRRIWLIAEAGVLTALAALSMVLQTDPLSLSNWIYLSPIGFFYWFALGMALALGSVLLSEHGGRDSLTRLVARFPTAIWGLALALYVVVCLLLSNRPPTEPLTGTGAHLTYFILYGLVALLLLLPATFGERAGGAVRGLLGSRPLSWLGLVSYGIFLYNFPIMVALLDEGATGWIHGAGFAVLGTAMALGAIACGALSYYIVERPFLRLKYRGGARGAGPAPHRLRARRAGAR